MKTIINKKCLTKILLFSVWFWFISIVYAQNISPIGYWRTIDDHTHKPAGVVQIWQEQNVLYGKIVKIFPVDGNKPTDICKNCPGDFHNKPILGLTILGDLKAQTDGSWGNGWIMDPKIGRTYRCKMTLSDDGNQLSVRGYIGITLLGRTQTWDRINWPIK